jgi:hypothetical protein
MLLHERGVVVCRSIPVSGVHRDIMSQAIGRTVLALLWHRPMGQGVHWYTTRERFWLGSHISSLASEYASLVFRFRKLCTAEQRLLRGYKRECFGGKMDITFSAEYLSKSGSNEATQFEVCRSKSNMCWEVGLVGPAVQGGEFPC